MMRERTKVRAQVSLREITLTLAFSQWARE
jgi:hypothetical protein